MIGRIAEFAAACGRALKVLHPKRTFGPAEIDPYFGYSTPDEIVIRGRVLSRRPDKGKTPAKLSPTIWTNFKSMAALFNTRELENVAVRCQGQETFTDEEGYFSLSLPKPDGKYGWVSFDCYFNGGDAPAALTALLPSPNAEFGIISDIDDTLIKTETWSLLRNLWNSLTGSAESRLVFSDAVALVETLHDGVNPVFYVSSSPWNLHAFLSEIFDRAGLIRGPKFLRDLGVSKQKLVNENHHSRKTRSIDTILAANPSLTFILIGDTGQHDARVYHDTIKRHPNRIRQVILRAPHRSIGRSDIHWIENIMATSTPIFVGETYDALLKS
jgi:phosphatidate phosphatase APP1